MENEAYNEPPGNCRCDPQELRVSPDPAYRPIQVGKTLSGNDLDLDGDDVGENISDRNGTSSELTALYWAWKNSPAEISGLAHYRRYFAGHGWRGVATGDEISEWMDQADLVVAAPRRYYIETVRSHYARAHHESDLDVCREVVSERCAEYLPAFDTAMARRQLSLYNMMITRHDTWDTYCQWLFPILDDCYRRIPIETYGPQQRRVIGYLGERLLNVWRTKHAGELRVMERPVVSLEREPIVKKGVGLLQRRVGLARAD